jgi:membrane protein YdbS with pleckstrin-like domain
MPPRDSDPRGYRRGDDDPDDGDSAARRRAYGGQDDSQTEEIPREPVYEDEIAPLHYDASGLLRPGRILQVEEEPSTLVARYLFPTEKFRGEWRKHWTYLFDQFAYGAVATFIFGWLWGFLVKHRAGTATSVVIIVWVLVMTFISFRVADWYFDRFILTNKRIMAVKGMVSRTVAMMPLLRVTDMKYEQSALGRLFNYGTFVLESAGQEQALREVKHLPNPNELYLRIVEEMYEPEAVEAKLAARSADLDDDGS